MPTIRKRAGAKGTRFEAIIRRHRNGGQSYRESRTFDTRSGAEQWAKERENQLDDPPAQSYVPHSRGPSLAALIRWYIDSFQSLTPWSRTKQTTLEYLERHSIGKVNARALNTTTLVDHIRARRASGVAAAAIELDMRSHARQSPTASLLDACRCGATANYQTRTRRVLVRQANHPRSATRVVLLSVPSITGGACPMRYSRGAIP